jgi:anti-sigma factor RsiW
VSACPTHGALVGGYVLGALEPREMEEMRRHLEDCPHCGPEARRLGALPGLLDRIEPADVPPPTLSPQVEEAVLDRFARERGPAERERSRGAWWRARRRSGQSEPSRGRTLRGRSDRWIAALAATCAAALVLGLALASPLGDDGADPAYASALLGGLAPAPEAGATAEVADVPGGTHVRLSARGLPGGATYELWCVRADGRWVSGGTFWADGRGRAEAELTAAVRPGDYHTMVVTSRVEGAPQGARGTPVLRGQLRY